MNDHPDDIDLVTEERLRRAVRFRDAEVSTSPDALARIRANSMGRGPASKGVRPGILVGAAAALVLVLGGVALAFRGGDDSPDVATDTAADEPAPDASADLTDPVDDTDGAVSSPTSSLLPSTTAAPPATTTLPPLPDLTARERADEGLVVWPLDSRSFQDPSTLTYSYATQALGIDDPSFETRAGDDGVVLASIAQRAEDGSAFGEATQLEMVPLDQFNWVVVRARSEELGIRAVRVTGDGLATVAGFGRSFEGAARIVARSICDPEGVITPVTVGGGPEFADFSQSIAYVPCDAPLVVELATEVVIDAGVPFVSAVAHVEPDVELVWSVMRVAPDDVLNVRSGPGIDNAIVATLAPDATGIVLPGATESIGGDQWVEITTPDGDNGWVNLSYLTAQPATIGPEDAVTPPDPIPSLLDAPSAVIGDRGVYVGGIGIFADAPTPFVHIDRADFESGTVIDFNPFPDGEPCDDMCRVSAREFLDFSSIVDRIEEPLMTGVAHEVSFEEQFLYGPLDQLQLFDSAASVTVEVPATSEGDLDWRRYHLWFDWTDGTPRVIAIWYWGWTP